jgi:CO/xanthine dehydrogenase FAD-binding subunit
MEHRLHIRVSLVVIWSEGVRLVFGGVAAHPFRSVDSENFLRGKNIEETSAGQVSEVPLTNPVL